MTDSLEIAIDERFKSWLTTATAEEDADLERELVREQGPRDALVVWPHEGRNLLVDGFRRHRICLLHRLPFRTVPKYFKSEQEAFNWMIDNQLARRNVNAATRTYLMGKKFNDVKSPRINNLLPKAHCEPSGDSARRVAASNDVSKSTVKRAAEFARAVDAIKEKVGEEEARAVLASGSPVKQKQAKGLAALANTEPDVVRAAIHGEVSVNKALGKEQKPKPFKVPKTPTVDPAVQYTQRQAQGVIWDLGVMVLRAIDGTSDSAARGIIGEMMKESGGREDLVAAAIAATAYKWPAEARSYLRVCVERLKVNAKERGNGKTKAVAMVGASTDTVGDWRARDARVLREDLKDAPDEATRKAIRNLLNELPRIKDEAESLRRYQAIYQR